MPSRNGPVHVATTSRTYKGKLYKTHLLRRTYRENGKVKKRTLANLTKLPEHLIEVIRGALKGPVKGVGEAISGAIFGVLFVLHDLARQCGLPRALGGSRLARLALFLVLARIAHQGSRLSAVRI